MVTVGTQCERKIVDNARTKNLAGIYYVAESQFSLLTKGRPFSLWSRVKKRNKTHLNRQAKGH